MYLNFWALYSTQNPQSGEGIYIFVPIFSDHRYSSFFPEDGTVIFKIYISGLSVTAKNRTGSWCGHPPPSYLPCSGIE